MNIKTICLVVGATLVGGLGSQFLQDSPPASTANSAPIKEYVIAPPSPKAPETGGAIAIPFATPITRQPARIQSNEMGRSLLEAKDLHAFVIDALSKPEKGGAYYAGLALDQCSEIDTAQNTVQRVVVAESTIDTERMRRIEASINRCSQLTPSEIVALQNQVLKLGMDGSDPLMALQLRFSKSKGDERQALLETIIKQNITLASFNDAPTQLLRQHVIEQPDGSLVYQFNGEKYTSSRDVQALSAAMMLSTCNDNTYCALDAQISSWCQGMSGQCFDSREQFVRQALLKGDTALFAQAQGFANAIRESLSRGDASIFR